MEEDTGILLVAAGLSPRLSVALVAVLEVPLSRHWDPYCSEKSLLPGWLEDC